MTELASTKFSPQEIEQALTVLAAEQGNATRTAKILKEEGLAEVNKSTLEKWKTDTYSEMYLDLERKVEQRMEKDLIAMLRARAHRASEIEMELLERIATVGDYRELPQALRAVNDTKAKSLDALLKLTGRAPSEGDSTGLEQLVDSMVRGGYLRVNVDLSNAPRPEEIDGG